MLEKHGRATPGAAGALALSVPDAVPPRAF
jgi:hypothetical protein